MGNIKAIKVALIHRDGPRGFDRSVGWWAYDVPEFEVAHFPVPKYSRQRKAQFGNFDIILQEDHKTKITWEGDGRPPRCYHIVDSPCSRAHYLDRRQYATGADLILLDCDTPKRFKDIAPVRRFNYCVNTQRYYDRGVDRNIDVGWYYRPNFPARRELDLWLKDFCKDMGWTYSSGKRVKGNYATSLAQTKIAINLARYETMRTHRVFDAMACGCCLVTSPIVDVPGEKREAGKDYVVFTGYDDLAQKLEWLMAGNWNGIAKSGKALVDTYHTWDIRAKELHKTLLEVFPWLES